MRCPGEPVFNHEGLRQGTKATKVTFNGPNLKVIVSLHDPENPRDPAPPS
jgi:hypothetical protein